MTTEAVPLSSADPSTWCQRVHEAQVTRLSTEDRAALLQRVEDSRVLTRNMESCRLVLQHSERSVALSNEGLRQMSRCRMPSEYTAAQARWQSAQDASERRQDEALGLLGGLGSVAPRASALRRADERSEALAEVVQLAGATDLGAFMDDANRAGAPASADATVQALLAQLAAEPADDEECAAKFSLYEGYGQQVEKMRTNLFGLYDANSATLPQSVASEMQRRLRLIDTQETMGIPDGADVWFVHHMMGQASSNNGAMAGLLRDLERKMELLASAAQAECPVCLEPFAAEGARAPETLTCCHRVCGDCWRQWSVVSGGQPFCPLCRHDAFLDAVTERATRR